jgi:hypothetical protein
MSLIGFRRLLHAGFVHLGGHEGADNGDLFALARRQLRAIAGIEGHGGFIALLDHLGHQQQNFVITQQIAAGFGAGRDVAILQRRQNEAHGGKTLGVFRLHRLFHCVSELLAKRHGICLFGKDGTYVNPEISTTH